MVKKIAFVMSSISIGGGETVVCTLLKNLNKEKYTVKLFVTTNEVDNTLTQELRNANIDVQFVHIKHDYNYIRTFEILSWLNKQLKSYKPDVINVHLDTLYSWMWALVKKKRIVFTVHSEAGRICNFVSKKLFHLLNRKKLIRVIGVSDFASQSFKNVFGADEIQTIYNPVDIAHFDLDISNEREEIVFTNVARFFPVKNHKLLIDAFEKLYRTNQNVRLELVGDGQEYENIKDYVSEKKLNDGVKFWGYKADVAEILNHSDVFVLSSLSEAFPISVIEALAAGLPVVATNVGGLPELVQDNGILVESENVDAFYQAMEKLAQDKEMRKKMGACSKEMSKNFSIDRILQQYEKVYDEESQKEN